ncbi:NAD(P)-dependent alcohol dehydrogenase [Isoptericola sp. F-RaC21]|uniref:NAD(P)-dependent alcohol dehydrogenase n=1 Tax=Isoptericola sp. F-RaC21 TaxID=3141452 RepID=UPI00315BCB7B
MTAVVQDRYGPAPEGLLRLARVEVPTVADDEVLVRTHASSIDRGTWHIMSGLPYPIRLAGFGARRPKYLNPGRALAGTVEAVGAAVSGLARGYAVYGTGTSTFAEHAVAPADQLAPKPANLSFDQAAAVPVSGLTALQAVREHGRVRAGQRVLVVGASGGVGSFAVQIAVADGAAVTAVCSAGKASMVRALGVDAVVDYTREDFVDAGPFDLVLDIGGNASLSRLRRALTPRGRLVIVGGETDGRWLGGSDRQLRAKVLSPFVGQRLGTFVASENSADLETLRGLAEDGAVTPVVDRTYPLADVVPAIRHLLDGRARGKVVVTVLDDARPVTPRSTP